MSSQPAPARRNTVRFVVDLVATILLLLFLVVLTVGIIATATQVNDVGAAECAARAVGEECNAGLLATAVFGVIAVSVVASFVAFGMVIVALIRRRVLFVWPLGAIVVLVVLYYAGIWLAGVSIS